MRARLNQRQLSRCSMSINLCRFRPKSPVAIATPHTKQTTSDNRGSIPPYMRLSRRDDGCRGETGFRLPRDRRSHPVHIHCSSKSPCATAGNDNPLALRCTFVSAVFGRRDLQRRQVGVTGPAPAIRSSPARASFEALWTRLSERGIPRPATPVAIQFNLQGPSRRCTHGPSGFNLRVCRSESRQDFRPVDFQVVLTRRRRRGLVASSTTANPKSQERRRVSGRDARSLTANGSRFKHHR